MDLERSLKIVKALADSSRLRVLGSLLDGQRYVEELAERLALAASTVSFHLRKLEEAGLVTKQREQYYAVYRSCPELLELRLRELVPTGGAEQSAQQERARRYERKTLQTFFDGERLTRMPAQRKKRRICLQRFADDLEPGRRYVESELNELIARRYEDYCTVRRGLIEEGLAGRCDGVYWLRPAPTTSAASADSGAPASANAGQEDTMDKQTRKELKQSYKLTERQAGIYCVRNRSTGRLLVGSTVNLRGALNRQRFLLETVCHPCAALEQDWRRLGAEHFDFEVLATVEPSSEPGFDPEAALVELEQAWIAQLQPPSERCYNSSDKIRTLVF